MQDRTNLRSRMVNRRFHLANFSSVVQIVVSRPTMNEAIMYAVGAMVCYGLGDFVYKQSTSAGIRADHFLVGQAWFFCPLIIVYALVTHTFVAVKPALWGSLAGVFVFVGLYYFIRSLATGSVSINASIFRLNFIVTAALAIALLGEPLTLVKLGGLALALVGTWLLLRSDHSAAGTFDPSQRLSITQV